MNILALIGIAIGGAIGALSRGLLTRMLKRHLPEQLGGFSTLATMNFEAVSLFATKRYKYCFAYLAITYASTLGAAALGFALVSFFIG